MKTARTFTLAIPMIEKLKEESKKTDIPQSQIVERALETYFSDKETEKEGA